MKNLFILFLFAPILFIACDKDDPFTLSANCDLLKEGLVHSNDTLISEEINTLCFDLNPDPSKDDALGHRQNLFTLVNRIEVQCGFMAEVDCYGCIETLPLQSHITIEVSTKDSVYTRVLDIRTPEEDRLSYVRTH